MSRAANRQGGWTLWETIVGMSLIAMALLAFGNVFSSTETLVRDGRAQHRADESLRRNLEAIANVLRDVEKETLAGFDAYGRSSNPSFARVVGADRVGLLYGPSEELRWTASTGSVPGVETPGRVVHVVDGVERLVADRVPGGTFSVFWEEDTLVVEVTTYYVVDNHVEFVRGRTGLAIRN
jgi:hypothetical protein